MLPTYTRLIRQSKAPILAGITLHPQHPGQTTTDPTPIALQVQGSKLIAATLHTPRRVAKAVGVREAGIASHPSHSGQAGTLTGYVVTEKVG